ncbi:DUF2993 domain-containing protein [Kitasatospora sp. NPDC056138]|uniref:LmeA family phospholipid-binding protein n=1 Tax=Kitasatospora sp. NPDC056138 TaxID=3345724 RepID=UPI0035E18258
MGRRWPRTVAVVVVVLAGLCTAADRIAVHYAESEATQLVRQKYGYGAGTTDGFTDVSIHGFPFLTQAAGRELDHVTLTAGNFTLNTAANAQGDYLNVAKLSLDLHDVKMTSLSARTAEANLVTGDLTLSYEDLSGVLTRLMGNGGALTVGPAPGSDGQQARVSVTGTWDGRPLETTATLTAQGEDIVVSVPGIGRTSYDWRVDLPQNAGFDTARSTPTGVDLALIGHQVVLGASSRGR